MDRNAMRGALTAVLLLATAACTSKTAGQGTRAACAPVFVGVPGSGQGTRNAAPGGQPAGITAADARAYGSSIARVKNALLAAAGSRAVVTRALDYPAISTDKYLGITGLSPQLEVSEKAGVTALQRQLAQARAGGCADRAVLLAGYSQGAEVVVRTVRALAAAQRRHVTVTLLGNPSYRPHLTGDYPGGTGASGLRPTFEDGQAFLLPGDVRTRTLDVCAPGDTVCGVPHEITELARLIYVATHTATHAHAYADDDHGYASAAGRYLWRHRAG
jgi:hypothetical protein